MILPSQSTNLSFFLALTLLPLLLSTAAVDKQQQDNVLRFSQEQGKQGDSIKESELRKGVTSPTFCNDLDCPDYKVLKNETSYELREYVATQWVSTSLKGVEFDEAENKMFFRLFEYISGKNNESRKIAMTVPVLTKIIPGQGPACENDFVMSFFVSPKEGQPPAPTDASVELTCLPALKVYVRSFGGFATMERWVQEAEQLAQDLGSSVPYEMSYYYIAGYDSPFKFFRRHNEIWFLAK